MVWVNQGFIAQEDAAFQKLATSVALSWTGCAARSSLARDCIRLFPAFDPAFPSVDELPYPRRVCCHKQLVAMAA